MRRVLMVLGAGFVVEIDGYIWAKARSCSGYICEVVIRCIFDYGRIGI